MGDWTKEPWEIWYWLRGRADRTRAARCVNACAGMEDPMEEINTLRFEVSTESATKHHFREAGKRLEDKDAEIAKLQARVKELEEEGGWCSHCACGSCYDMQQAAEKEWG